MQDQEDQEDQGDQGDQEDQEDLAISVPQFDLDLTEDEEEESLGVAKENEDKDSGIECDELNCTMEMDIEDNEEEANEDIMDAKKGYAMTIDADKIDTNSKDNRETNAIDIKSAGKPIKMGGNIIKIETFKDVQTQDSLRSIIEDMFSDRNSLVRDLCTI